MDRDKCKNIYILALILGVSFFSVFASFMWQGNKGFNLWDEGYLWYGVQRVLLGEVPIRDFMAYDPGRYYWSATLLSIIGSNGIMALRGVVAIFQALGLFVGLLLIAQSEQRKSKSSLIFWIMSAGILVVWMYPRHKLFDISLSIFLIGCLTFLITNPIPKRYVIAGIGVGLVAVFGRNHGVYGALGSIGVVAWLSIRSSAQPSFLKGLVLWGAGVAIGFLPVILMLLLIPGFAVAFWDSIRFLFEWGATNLPLPVPWPWTVNFSSIPTSAAIHALLLGLFFVALLVFGGLAVVWVCKRRFQGEPVPSVLAAAAFLAFPYAHYAFSRADIGHLALGIFPFLIGCLVILAVSTSRIKWFFTTALLVASVWVMHVMHPGWQCFTSQCVDVEISGSKLLVEPNTGSDIELLRRLVKLYASNGRSFVVTPTWPGAYALLGRKSPMWEIYALVPRSDAFQKKEIERIKATKPGFVLVFNWALDGHDKLRFKNTHPLIYQYILDNFEPISDFYNSTYQVYKPKISG